MTSHRITDESSERYPGLGFTPEMPLDEVIQSWVIAHKGYMIMCTGLDKQGMHTQVNVVLCDQSGDQIFSYQISIDKLRKNYPDLKCLSDFVAGNPSEDEFLPLEIDELELELQAASLGCEYNDQLEQYSIPFRNLSEYCLMYAVANAADVTICMADHDMNSKFFSFEVTPSDATPLLSVVLNYTCPGSGAGFGEILFAYVPLN